MRYNPEELNRRLFRSDDLENRIRTINNFLRIKKITTGDVAALVACDYIPPPNDVIAALSQHGCFYLYGRDELNLNKILEDLDIAEIEGYFETLDLLAVLLGIDLHYASLFLMSILLNYLLDRLIINDAPKTWIDILKPMIDRINSPFPRRGPFFEEDIIDLGIGKLNHYSFLDPYGSVHQTFILEMTKYLVTGLIREIYKRGCGANDPSILDGYFISGYLRQTSLYSEFDPNVVLETNFGVDWKRFGEYIRHHTIERILDKMWS